MKTPEYVEMQKKYLEASRAVERFYDFETYGINFLDDVAIFTVLDHAINWYWEIKRFLLFYFLISF